MGAREEARELVGMSSSRVVRADTKPQPAGQIQINMSSLRDAVTRLEDVAEQLGHKIDAVRATSATEKASNSTDPALPGSMLANDVAYVQSRVDSVFRTLSNYVDGIEL